uniref:Uncharacterized protein n=1 Tax=Peronospora matthiolae TaxID=2874970 RepID=A0AAV1UG52_9STRA
MRLCVVLIPFVAASVANCASVTGLDPRSVEDVTTKFLAARGLRAQSEPFQEERAVPVTDEVLAGPRVEQVLTHVVQDQPQFASAVAQANRAHATPEAVPVHQPNADVPAGPQTHPEPQQARATAEAPEAGATSPKAKELTPEQQKNSHAQAHAAPEKTSKLRKTFYWLAGILGVTGAATLLFKLWQNHHSGPPESTAAAGTLAPPAASSLV